MIVNLNLSVKCLWHVEICSNVASMNLWCVLMCKSHCECNCCWCTFRLELKNKKFSKKILLYKLCTCADTLIAEFPLQILYYKSNIFQFSTNTLQYAGIITEWCEADKLEFSLNIISWDIILAGRDFMGIIYAFLCPFAVKSRHIFSLYICKKKSINKKSHYVSFVPT